MRYNPRQDLRVLNTDETNILKMLSEIDIADVIQQFPPIQFAFAYGSGVVVQGGYNYNKAKALPMIDFIFAVNDPLEWHTINKLFNADHYSSIIPMSGESIANIQDNYGAKIWYNTLISCNICQYPGRLMKYGVVSVHSLINDLNNWECIYVAGRLHKPVQDLKLKENLVISKALDINREHALRTSLLLLGSKFSYHELYTTIASISYIGDPRMIFGENPRKVKICMCLVIFYLVADYLVYQQWHPTVHTLLKTLTVHHCRWKTS